MRRNMLVKKITAGLMTGTMVMSMGGMTAFATEPSGTFNFTKKITTDENTLAPDVDFTFDIKAGTSTSNSDGYVVTPGPDNGLSASGVSFNGTETLEEETVDDEKIYYYSSTGTITVNKGAFKAPGIYSYVLTEDDFKAEGAYEGIKKDPNEYNLYVYMTDENHDGTLEYRGVTTTVLSSSADADQKAQKTPSLVVTNTYGTDETDDTIHDVTIKKIVDGNQGDTTHEFTFTLKVDGAVGEQYKVVKKNAQGAEVSLDGQDKITSGANAVTYTLKHNETLTIYGLSATDQYTVNEVNNEGDLTGYTTTVATEFVTSTSENDSREQIGTVVADNAEINYTNNKSVTTPTGIAMTFAPYAVMVAFAGVFAVMFLRKKREDF